MIEIIEVNYTLINNNRNEIAFPVRLTVLNNVVEFLKSEVTICIEENAVDKTMKQIQRGC